MYKKFNQIFKIQKTLECERFDHKLDLLPEDIIKYSPLTLEQMTIENKELT